MLDKEKKGSQFSPSDYWGNWYETTVNVKQTWTGEKNKNKAIETQTSKGDVNWSELCIYNSSSLL